MRTPVWFIVAIVLLSCHQAEKSSTTSTTTENILRLKYADGFTVATIGHAKLVNVNYPYQGATTGYKYLLVHPGDSVPVHDSDTRVIEIPIQRLVCTSTTHIPFLTYLDEGNALTGFPSTDYICDTTIRKRIDAGLLTDLGVDKGINMERLVTLHPDLVMGYAMSSDYSQFKKMEELGIPVVLNAEYLEKHPLGRAEWIKFMALFFDKETMADSIFKQIEQRYVATKATADSLQQKPTVLSGVVYGDAWFLPGGQNYATKLLHDAGARYVWDDDTNHGFLQLSFEAVYLKARDADYWIGVGSYNTLAEIEAADHRYAKFKPFKTKQVYTYNARLGAKGGSEFMELGYLRPDIILEDLVTLLHPELKTNHPMYFYKALR